jgi:hypothetical protein
MACLDRVVRDATPCDHAIFLEIREGTMRKAFSKIENWMCRFVPALPSSVEYLAELSGVVGLTGSATKRKVLRPPRRPKDDNA